MKSNLRKVEIRERVLSDREVQFHGAQSLRLNTRLVDPSVATCCAAIRKIMDSLTRTKTETKLYGE